MTKHEQELMHLPIRFLSCGYIRGKMYWLNDGKHRRYFVIPPMSKREHINTFIYGGIFVINDFAEYERALSSYYNCSISYCGKIMQEDFYKPLELPVTPIKFNSLKDFEEQRLTRLSDIPVSVYIGNTDNHKVQRSVATSKQHRRVSGIDVPNFLTMIVENKL